MDKLSVELCVQNKKDFKLIAIPIEIAYVSGTTFKVREIR